MWNRFKKKEAIRNETTKSREWRSKLETTNNKVREALVGASASEALSSVAVLSLNIKRTKIIIRALLGPEQQDRHNNCRTY